MVFDPDERHGGRLPDLLMGVPEQGKKLPLGARRSEIPDHPSRVQANLPL